MHQSRSKSQEQQLTINLETLRGLLAQQQTTITEEAENTGKLGQTSTDFEVKQRKSARNIGIDHS